MWILLVRAFDGVAFRAAPTDRPAGWLGPTASVSPVEGPKGLETQASYVCGLSVGLMPDELTDAAATLLVELIRSADSHPRTGFLSTGDLLPVLSDLGHADDGGAILHVPTYADREVPRR